VTATGVQAQRHTSTALLVAALALTGLTMRTAITSVGAVLDEVEDGLHTNSGLAGVLTTLPVLCFAGLGAISPRFAGRFGPHRVLVVALLISAAGLIGRALVSSIWLFLLLSVFALTGGAVANVVLPSLVKLHFPDRIGPMTAVYTTALAMGATAGAGLTVPIGDAGGGWRFGIASWALFAVVAVLPWLPTVVHDVHLRLDGTRLSALALTRSRTAWLLTGFFAAQSMTAYVAFGWIARFMHAHGESDSTSGWMVAVLSAIGIPVAMVVPNVPARHQRAVIITLASCFAVAYLGLGIAPVGGAWLWMLLYGIGMGMFPVALVMIAQRTRTSATTAALSAFVQVIGYLVAGTGPLLFGVLYGVTGSWVMPLALLWISLGLSVVFGWLSCAPRYVDDELRGVTGAIGSGSAPSPSG
jgi:CP family cyanate transporter-like MFS transporter